MTGKDGFMDYLGYRNMVVENKIDECLSAYEDGADSVTFDRDDLTDDELEYIEQEVQRRIGNR